MSLNDHITDRAQWRCTGSTLEGKQCARWKGHTIYVVEDVDRNHMDLQEVLGLFMMVLGAYEKYNTEQIVDMVTEHHELAKLWYLRATLIYNSKVYIQGVDDAL